MKFCSNCGAPFEKEDQLVCTKCGTKAEESIVWKCQVCNTLNASPFCPVCGNKNENFSNYENNIWSKKANLNFKPYILPVLYLIFSVFKYFTYMLYFCDYLFSVETISTIIALACIVNLVFAFIKYSNKTILKYTLIFACATVIEFLNNYNIYNYNNYYDNYCLWTYITVIFSLALIFFLSKALLLKLTKHKKQILKTILVILILIIISIFTSYANYVICTLHGYFITIQSCFIRACHIFIGGICSYFISIYFCRCYERLKVVNLSETYSSKKHIVIDELKNSKFLTFVLVIFSITVGLDCFIYGFSGLRIEELFGIYFSILSWYGAFLGCATVSINHRSGRFNVFYFSLATVIISFLTKISVLW